MFIGWDGGRSFTKIAYNHDVVCFPSYVMQGKQLDLTSSGDIMNNLIVDINGEQYFVGNLAKQEGGSREFTKAKAEHPNTIPLLLTSVALVSEEDIVSPKIVVGLPISDYQKQAKSFESKIKGIYEIKLPHKELLLDIRADNVICFPEGAGTAWNLVLDSSGRVSNSALISKQIGILDIGWKTMNFCALQGMNYDNSKSGTLPLGISTAFKSFYKRISNEQDLTLSEAETLFLKHGQPELKQLAQKIKDDISVWWTNLGIFDSIYLAGGGGVALADYFDDKFKVVDDAQYSNAKGFLKIAKAQL